MKKISVIITVLIAIAMIAGLSGCDMYSSDSDANVTQAIQSNQDVGIAVTGTGEVQAAPDMAVVSIGVEVQMETLKDAQQQAADSMDAVVGTLKSHSIAAKDIQTSRYSIKPVSVWDNNEYRLVGYSVTNIVTVKIRNLDDTGTIIDDAVDAGGEYVIINGISFAIDDNDLYYEQARTAAMADAKNKATQLAKSAGVKVGLPISINESSYYTSRSNDLVCAEKDGQTSTSISPGELTVTIYVQVVYAIG